MGQLPSRLTEPPKDKPVYVICASGNRSLSMTGFLIRAGHAAYSVAGAPKPGRSPQPPRKARSGKPDNPDSSQEPILSFAPRFVCACPRALKVLVTASVVGLLAGFFGVGSGFAVVPALVLALGFTMPVAVGTSLLVIAINSASALVSRLGQGVHLDWTLIGIFTAAAIIGSLLGGRVTPRVHPRLLSQAFALLLVADALYTAARSIPQLL